MARGVFAPVKSAVAGGKQFLSGGIYKLQNVAYGAGGYLVNGALSERIEQVPAIAQYGAVAVHSASLGGTYLLAKLLMPAAVESAMFGAALNVVMKVIKG